MDNFTYRGSIVSSTKKAINSLLAKTWTTSDRLSVIWKSDLIDKIKCNFFPRSGHVDTVIGMHYMDPNQTYREKARWQLHKNAASCIEHVLEETPHIIAAVRPHSTHHKNYIEVRTNS